MRKLFCCLIMISILVGCLSGCSGNNHHSEDNPKEPQSTQSLNFEDPLEEVKFEYKTADEVIESFNKSGIEYYDKALSNLNLLSETAYVSDNYFDMLDELKQSKTYYADGLSKITKKDYSGAIANFNLVVSYDNLFEYAKEKAKEATDKFCEEWLAAIDKCIDRGDYQAAFVDVYDEWGTIFRHDLISKYEIISDYSLDDFDKKFYERYQQYLDSAIKEVRENLSNAKYDEAMTVLQNDLLWLYEDEWYYYPLNQAWADCWEAFNNNALDKAEKAFGNNKDYAAAIKELQHALAIMQEGATYLIDEAMVKYQEYIPIGLTSLKYDSIGKKLKIGGSDVYDHEICIDINETPYDISKTFYLGGGSFSYYNIIEDESLAQCTYFLNSKYSTLTGTLYVPYVAHLDTWKTKNPIFKVYGDGVEIYSYNGFTKENYAPVDFMIDITGVRYLKIVLLGNFYDHSDGMEDCYPKICATNLTVAK